MSGKSLQDQLYAAKRKLRADRRVTLRVPAGFSFNRAGQKNFGPVVEFFDWSLKKCPVEIDFTGCSSANYQALALIVPYCWHLKQAGCSISFKFDKNEEQSASHMWSMMGGHGLFSVATDSSINFKSTEFKPLIAVRNPSDMKVALDRAVNYVARFGVEYQRTLRYVLAELLYNASEHGRRDFMWRGNRIITPAILQFSWYEQANEIGILVADVGVGVQNHLAQAYPTIGSGEEALRLAVQPEISGTFGKHDPYTNRNNAGMGLFLSSNIVRRLRADMHIVSDDAVLHVSPNDLTSHTLSNRWNGTFVLISMRLDQSYQFAYDQMMQEFRVQARTEVTKRQNEEVEKRHYLHVYNFFGKYAEDKSAAISYRNRHLLDAVDNGQAIVLDFDGVESSTHSFLNALLASPIRRMGMSAYKKIKVTRALPDIRETIDYVLDALYFLQYPNDLTFTEPALTHLGLLGNIVCPRPPVMRGPILREGYKPKTTKASSHPLLRSMSSTKAQPARTTRKPCSSTCRNTKEPTNLGSLICTLSPRALRNFKRMSGTL